MSMMPAKSSQIEAQKSVTQYIQKLDISNNDFNNNPDGNNKIKADYNDGGDNLKSISLFLDTIKNYVVISKNYFESTKKELQINSENNSHKNQNEKCNKEELIAIKQTLDEKQAELEKYRAYCEKLRGIDVSKMQNQIIKLTELCNSKTTQINTISLELSALKQSSSSSAFITQLTKESEEHMKTKKLLADAEKKYENYLQKIEEMKKKKINEIKQAQIKKVLSIDEETSIFNRKFICGSDSDDDDSDYHKDNNIDYCKNRANKRKNKNRRKNNNNKNNNNNNTNNTDDNKCENKTHNNDNNKTKNKPSINDANHVENNKLVANTNDKKGNIDFESLDLDVLEFIRSQFEEKNKELKKYIDKNDDLLRDLVMQGLDIEGLQTQYEEILEFSDITSHENVVLKAKDIENTKKLAEMLENLNQIKNELKNKKAEFSEKESNFVTKINSMQYELDELKLKNYEISRKIDENNEIINNFEINQKDVIAKNNIDHDNNNSNSNNNNNDKNNINIGEINDNKEIKNENDENLRTYYVKNLEYDLKLKSKIIASLKKQIKDLKTKKTKNLDHYDLGIEMLDNSVSLHNSHSNDNNNNNNANKLAILNNNKNVGITDENRFYIEKINDLKQELDIKNKLIRYYMIYKPGLDVSQILDIDKPKKNHQNFNPNLPNKSRNQELLDPSNFVNVYHQSIERMQKILEEEIMKNIDLTEIVQKLSEKHLELEQELRRIKNSKN